MNRDSADNTGIKMPIYLPKWVQVMVTLHNMPHKERYCQKLYRKLRMNSSHVRTMIQNLEKLGLINRVSDSKIRHIALTEKGIAIAELAIRMKSVLKEAGVDE